MPTYEGRLELTWTNKHLRLLAHEDGSYGWVPPSDYRVAEVRLLHDVATVGDVAKVRAVDNLLIRGDALSALTSLSRLPEFAAEYLGKVKLVYIDPPFNTQQSFLHYDDALEHSVWLTMMRDRLLQVRDLLTPDGTVWLHLDDAEAHRARCVLDEIFGTDWFIGTIIWKKADTLRNDARRFSVSHDFLLVYGPPTWQAQRLPRTEGMNEVYRNPDSDPRGPWLAGTLISPHFRTSGDFEVTTPGGAVHRAPKGTSWRVPRETFDRLLRDSRIWFGRDGRGTPQQKLFLSDAKDRVVDTIWDVKDVGGNRQSKAEIKKLFPGVVPFDTPKPERLLQRILHVASEPGDVVLDCFLGSGTTAAVAHKMDRRWVGVEWSEDTISTYALPRLTKVVENKDAGGITRDVGWNGGGGFRVLDVAASMFEADRGLVFLADWMTNGSLAEATAAQLGFSYETDPPFSGRKGRTRLAVVDGVVNESVIRLVVSALPERERVVVCGTGIDTDARPILRDLRPGSTLRKIPAALLDQYRSARQLRLSPASSSGSDGASSQAARPQVTV